MAGNRVSLTDGYSGAQQKNNAIGDEGANALGMSKKQLGAAEALQGANKGALASQGANGSTATANNLSAGGNLHNANADNSTRYLRQTGQHEEAGANSQASESKIVETGAMDLHGKVNNIRT